MTKTEELNKLNKMLKLAWQVKDFEGRGYGFDLVSQVALSINMSLNRSIQNIDDANRLEHLAWTLHTRINDTDPINLPTIGVKALYSKLKHRLDEFITKGVI